MKALIADHWKMLTELGYNPITKTFSGHAGIDYDINADTPFLEAIKKTLPKLTVVDHTRRDIKSVVQSVEKAAMQLRFNTLTISQVSKKHIKLILEKISKTKELSAKRYNLYRSYLSSIFNELEEIEAVAANPVRSVKKLKEFKKLRVIPTPEQRKMIDDYIKEKMNVFINSFTCFSIAAVG